MRDTERELAQAGIRNRAALARYTLGHAIFAALMLAKEWPICKEITHYHKR